MKLEAYTCKKKADKQIKLGLEDIEGRNYISLGVVDEKGDMIPGGCLLRIYRFTGEIERKPDVSEEYGFKLDSKNRIIVE